jgi:hypothetical protein
MSELRKVAKEFKLKREEREDNNDAISNNTQITEYREKQEKIVDVTIEEKRTTGNTKP